MNYEEFRESFIEDIKEALYLDGIEANISITEVNKVNQSYEAITATPEGSSIGVNINIESFYTSHKLGEEYEAVVDKAVDIIETGFRDQPAVDIDSLTDYSKMKNKLVMEVVSAETNADVLKTVPHVEMEDMAVVYRFVLNEDKEGRTTVLATNKLIESMGITPEQLHADAMVNAPVIKPAVIQGISEILSEMMGMSKEDFMNMGYPTEPGKEHMYIASVPDKIHGAGVIAYQDFMDEAAERLGGDFFILPSSLHEILLVPDDGAMSLEQLQETVREVNATQVSPEDKLTDNVYHYDSQNKIFELGEKYVERQIKQERENQERTEEKNSVLGDLKEKKEAIAKQPKKETVEKATKSRSETR